MQEQRCTPLSALSQNSSHLWSILCVRGGSYAPLITHTRWTHWVGVRATIIRETNRVWPFRNYSADAHDFIRARFCRFVPPQMQIKAPQQCDHYHIIIKFIQCSDVFKLLNCLLSLVLVFGFCILVPSVVEGNDATTSTPFETRKWLG